MICEQRLERGEGIFAIRDCEQSDQCQSQSVQLRACKSAVRPEQSQEGKQKLRSERQKGTMGPTNSRTAAFLPERSHRGTQVGFLHQWGLISGDRGRQKGRRNMSNHRQRHHGLYGNSDCGETDQDQLYRE